ncbi:thioredoxin reductase [Arthrobacter sp. B2I5]|uniref:NAD(P)/FAD-dependent oxidoreductase n=1 Tax=Arthrobacter sp. B2I5 TaxID=3042266 RepID=UPI00277D680D|nr:NAD(P)/FAD-dependent oxidoreductase [Arthrobacter sp. B2I5]MDQ0824572.1 thioredoxin reductase [Arthrobacter sp. B2I5]
MESQSHFEVAIIGGGPAGMAAAQVLGRQRRRVVLLDGHQGRNAAASSVHMLLGREGMTPEGLVLAARRELAGLHTVSLLLTEATNVLVEDSRVLVSAAAAGTIYADFLILATGVVDVLPPIPGVGSAYGTCLFHCPLCHGFEVRDQRLVVLGNSEHAAFMAAYVHDRISRDVELCTNGKPDFCTGTRERLSRGGILIVNRDIVGIRASAGGLALLMGDSTVRTYNAGFLSTRFRQGSPLPHTLGCRLTDDGRVQVDHFQRTSVPRVLAVGDMAKATTAAANMTFVATAVASGVTAAAFLDEDIFAKTWDAQGS